MDIRSTLAQFQTSVQSFVRENPSALKTSRPDPYQLHNKGYRDVLVSSNILRKSLQLYNDITSSQSRIDSATTSARDFLAQIEAKSVTDVLQSHVKIDIAGLAESLRGSRFDRAD